jgi:hypothetical protein
MKLISRLWEAGTLPIKNGIYYADGRSLSLTIKRNENLEIKVGKQFSLEELYAIDPDYITNIDITKEKILPNDEYFCCGEGSSGAEGFFAYLDSNKKLLWVIYFEELNPFYDFTINDTSAIIKSTLDIQIKLNINNPLLLQIL